MKLHICILFFTHKISNSVTESSTPGISRNSGCVFNGGDNHSKTMSRRQHKYIKNMDPKRLFPDLKIGLKKSKKYRPSYGYEPYWPEGNWLYEHTQRPEDDDVCGSKCNLIYKSYGKVCARSHNNEYETFANYCEVEKRNCGVKHTAGQGWLVLHRGDCMRDLVVFPSSHGNELPDRARQLMQEFDNKYGTLRTPPSTKRRSARITPPSLRL